MRNAITNAIYPAFRSMFNVSDFVLKLFGDSKGGSSLVASGGVVTSYLIDGVTQVDDASTNFVTYSSLFINSIWGVVAGTNGGTTSKTQYGITKSANGTRDIPLYNGHDNLWRYNTTTGLSVPANTAGKEYVISFLYKANADQLCIFSLDGGTTKQELCFKQGWQRAVFRTGYRSTSSNISLRWDFRRISTGLVLDTITGFAFALDDVQVEEVTIGERPTSYIYTLASSASRGAGVNASGQSFFCTTANQGKVFSAVINGVAKTIQYQKEYYIIFWGQSNWFYANIYNPYTMFVSSRIYALARRIMDASQVNLIGQQIPYKDPSQWNEALSSTSGTGGHSKEDMSCAGRFADLLCDNKNLPKITVFTENIGGSSYTNADWQVTTGLRYNEMMARVNAFISANPNAECVGIFGSLMEGDISGGMPYATFKTNYINTINGIRAVVGNVPVVHIGVQDDWSLAGGALALQYMAGFRGMNNNTFGLSKSRFLDTASAFNGGIIYESNADDGIGSPLDMTHFNADTHYNLFPNKLLEQYLLAG
jgi:hypothetical protein